MPKLSRPISLEETKVFVVTNDGQTYDFISLAKYLLHDDSKCISPVTCEPIDHMIYNRAIIDLTELAKHRNAIWCCLADSGYFNLSPEAHKTLLVDILRSEGDSPHPLGTLFSTPVPRSQGISRFFCCSKETTLEDIRAYTVVRYPLNSNPAL